MFFEYDADGLVHITVTDLTAKRDLGEMRIARKANLSEGEISEKATTIAKIEVN